MKLGIDIDGVLADFVSAHSQLIKEQASIILPPVSDSWPDVWDYHLAAGLTPEQDKAIWKIISTTGFWGTLHAIPGTLEVLERLAKLRYAEHDTYFITNRPGARAKFLTERWLSLHGMNNPTVLVASDKAPIAQSLGLDVFVEDRPENLLAVTQARSFIRGYLIDRPYNRRWTDQHWTRVKSVAEVLQREGLLGETVQAVDILEEAA